MLLQQLHMWRETFMNAIYEFHVTSRSRVGCARDKKIYIYFASMGCANIFTPLKILALQILHTFSHKVCVTKGHAFLLRRKNYCSVVCLK